MTHLSSLEVGANGTLTLPSISSAPSSPSVGELYYDSTLSQIRGYQAAGWTNMDGTAAGSLDGAYNGGQTITVDAADVLWNLSDATNDYKVTVANNTTGTIATGLLLDTAQANAGCIFTDAFKVTTSGANSTITDAIDVSDGDIVNAINVGANNIVGTTAVINFDSFDVDGSGNTTVGGTLGVTGATTLSSTVAISGTSTLEGVVIIDVDDAEAFLIRENADAADVLTIDTTQDAADTTMLLTTKVTSGIGLHINGSTIEGGDALRITVASGTMTSAGAAISVVDGSTEVFAVRDDGTVVMKGSSEGITVQTITGGDLTITAGDLILSGGEISATGNDNTGATLAITNNTATTFGAGTANGIVDFASTSLTTGTLFNLELTEATLTTGAYLQCWDVTAAAAVLKIKEDGEIEITGAGGSDMFTITAGDVVLSDGSVSITDADNAASLAVVNATATTADVATITANGLTTGSGLLVTSSGTITSAGEGLVNIVGTGITTGDGLKIDLTEATLNGGNYLNCYDDTGAASVFKIAEDGVTTITGTAGSNSFTLSNGDVVISDGSITMTDADDASSFVLTNNSVTSNTTASITTNGLTTGTGLLVTSSGTIVTTGELVSLVGNSATTCTGLLRASGTALTDGFVAEFTGGGAVATASGGVLALAAGAATLGSALKITTTGVYTGTTGVIDLNAASATEGVIMDIGGAGLTSGTALKINATEATLTTGKYLDCYDGAATDFSIARYGATTIAGNAAGTAALTVTAGDLFLSDTDTTIIESEDGTTTVVLMDNKAGVQADNTAILLLDAGGNNASGSNMLRLAPTGTPLEGAIGMEFVGGTKVMQAMNIDGDSVDNSVVLINGGGALAAGKGVLEVTNDGNLAANGTLVSFTVGGTPNAGAFAVDIDAQKDCIGFRLDSDAVTNDAFIITGQGNLAASKSMFSVNNAATPAANTAAMITAAFTGTATNNPRLFNAFAGTKDVFGLYSTTSASTAQDIFLENNLTGAVGVKIRTQQTSTGSAAADDAIVRYEMYGLDSANNPTEYARITGNIVSPTNTTEEGSIIFAVARVADGTLETQMEITDGRVLIGDEVSAAIISSVGAYDLQLETNEGTNSGTIVITDGANNDITLTPNGTGSSVITSAAVQWQLRAIAAATASDTPDGGDGIITCSTDGAQALTITLPDANTNPGLELTFQFDTDGGQNITINRAGADVIDETADLGNTAITMDDAGDFIIIRAVSANRWIVVKNAGCTLT